MFNGPVQLCNMFVLNTILQTLQITIFHITRSNYAGSHQRSHWLIVMMALTVDISIKYVCIYIYIYIWMNRYIQWILEQFYPLVLRAIQIIQVNNCLDSIWLSIAFKSIWSVFQQISINLIPLRGPVNTLRPTPNGRHFPNALSWRKRINFD